jgi:hypothetical protein
LLSEGLLSGGVGAAVPLNSGVLPVNTGVADDKTPGTQPAKPAADICFKKLRLFAIVYLITNY